MDASLKIVKCRFNGGSGFPAAICAAGFNTNRGLKADPTLNKLFALKMLNPKPD